MTIEKRLTSLVFLALIICVAACGRDQPINAQEPKVEKSEKKEQGREHDKNGDTEHRRDRESNNESIDGEESSKQYRKDQTYNQVRNGARLKLTYVAESNSFIGSVENTGAKTLRRVRVEVHLSNGIELGPTIPTDLAPGQRVRVGLKATKQEFDTWSAHPESGNDEHGKDGNHKEENDDDS